MPFTVKISPSVVAGTQAAIVPDASSRNAGLLSPELFAKLSTLVAPIEVLQASGPIGLRQLVTGLVSFSGPMAMTLGPGFDGQQKWLSFPFNPNPCVITPDGGFTTGQTTLTFNNPNDYAIMFYIGFAAKWGVLVTTGVLA